jgi:hypothetical protein
MPRTITTTMTVRLGGPLSEFVAANVGEQVARRGCYLLRRALLTSEASL